MKHPAKYNTYILKSISSIIENPDGICLDIFGGIGGIHKLKEYHPNLITIGIEIEPEWAIDGKCIIANSLFPPIKNNSVDIICTSPTYGNRMADHFIDNKPEKSYIRNTYTHIIGRQLSNFNSGKMQWGEDYRKFHTKCFYQAFILLKPNGQLILNIKDHIRNKQRICVTEWYIEMLKSIGFVLNNIIIVECGGNKFGANPNRIKYESLIDFRKN